MVMVQDHQDFKDLQDHLVKRERQDPKVSKAFKVMKEFREMMDLEVGMVTKVSLEKMADKEREVHEEFRENTVTRVNRVSLDVREGKVLQVLMD